MLDNVLALLVIWLALAPRYVGMWLAAMLAAFHEYYPRR